MTIYVMALEPIDTRYTGQWYEGLPKAIRNYAVGEGKKVDVVNVAGEQVSLVTTKGAFLNFSATNIWKNTQVNKLAEWFADGTICNGDKILFTDAWHSGILQVRYMSELLGVDVEIHSMWHAGSYDPQDFLGRLIEDKRWTYCSERAFFYASHYNYFATEFHRDLFLNTLFHSENPVDGLFLRPEPNKSVIAGQPHDSLVEHLAGFKGMEKRPLVLFPHRLAPEKQLEIFKDLAEHVPEAEFVVCQETKLTKDEYHTLLGKASVVFSANLQETLGISAMEGVLVDTIPMVPDRLSYSEMYLEPYKYPSKWTESWEDYIENRDNVINALRTLLAPSGPHHDRIAEQRAKLMDSYLNANAMICNLLA